MQKSALARQLIGRTLITALLLTATWPSMPVHAQSQPTIPPAAEASRSREQFQQTPAPRETASPAPSDSALLPLQDAPDGADEIVFSLNAIELSGNTIYSNEELAALYSDMIGKEIALSRIFELANAITVKYRSDGYVLSRALLPQQEIKDGRVRIEIVEGYVGKVIIQGGELLRSRAQIENYAAAITRQRPLNMRTVERYLLLIRDLPGHTAESMLRPAEEGRGAADLVLQVTFDRAMISAGVDTYGSKYLGPGQFNTRVEGNSLLLGGDQAVFRYVSTGGALPFGEKELRYFEGNYSVPVNDEGTTVSLAASRIISYPGNTLRLLDTTSQSQVLSAEVAHPVVRSRLFNINGRAQFEMINSRNRMAGSTLADDRLRVVRVGGTLDFVDGLSGVTRVSVTGSHGLDVLSASKSSSPELSRPRGEPVFKKFNIDIARVQRLFNGVGLYAGLRAQHSSNRLLSAEEFGVGGGEFGRGYDSSEITGDSGVAGRLELQFDGPPFWLTNSYQFFAFYDIGKTFNHPDKGGARESLASAGAGVRFNLGDNASGSLALAQPLTRKVSTHQGKDDERPLRILFSLNMRY